MDESSQPVEHYDPNLFELLKEEGPAGLLAAALIVVFTAALLISRIRGCFRIQPANTGRDLAFLVAGPISAMLLSTMKAIAAAQSLVAGGFDADFPLKYGLTGATAICSLALLCFAVGVIAFALPTKTKVEPPNGNG